MTHMTYTLTRQYATHGSLLRAARLLRLHDVVLTEAENLVLLCQVPASLFSRIASSPLAPSGAHHDWH